MADKYRILVKEKLADSGVDLLRQHFDVDLGADWDDAEFKQRIGDYHGILIRSATQLDAENIALAKNLQVIGRAGIGVDNVDVEAATKRGIVVANAPQSNIVAAAEHTVALMLSLARNIPQAHGSLTAGKWERSKFSGIEVYEKTLAVLGFGRIGQLVAERAKGFGMHILAYDPFVSSERFRELGVEQAATPEDLYGRADFITIHLPNTPETKGFVNAEVFAALKPGARLINCARGGLIDDQALKDALDSGKLAGAALDVFPSEPITDYPLFSGYDNVVVTPHLGASTTEAQDRAGVQTAEQVVAALTGGVVTTAVNIPSVSAEAMAALKPLIPLAEQLGALGVGLAAGGSIDRIEIEFLGRLADLDTQLLKLAVIKGALQGHTEEQINFVNAPSLAQERGIKVSETKASGNGGFTELIRVTVGSGSESVRVAGTGIGANKTPHLVEAWGQRFNMELEPQIVMFRYRDRPGMLGRIGSVFGQAGINISSAAVGRHSQESSDEGLAAMAVTTDVSVPTEVVKEILSSDDFVDARAVSLAL